MDRNRLVRVMVVLTLVLLAGWPMAPAAAAPPPPPVPPLTADIAPDCAGGRVTINGGGIYEVLIKVDGVIVLTLNVGPGSYPFVWPQAVLDDICNVHEATLEIGSLVRGPEPFGGDICCALKPLIIQQGLDGYLGAKDTFLSKWLPTKNYGFDGYIRTHTSSEQVGLLRFDLSALPEDATIISATLWLYLEMGFGRLRAPVGADQGLDAAPEAALDATLVTDFTLPIFFHPGTLEIYKQLAGWSESQANWNQAMTNDPWETPGGNGPTDREQEPLAIADITFPMAFVITGAETAKEPAPTIAAFIGSSHWITASVTSLVQGWVGDPATNQGMWMLAKSDVGIAYPFVSSNNWNKLYHPKLVLIYTTPE